MLEELENVDGSGLKVDDEEINQYGPGVIYYSDKDKIRDLSHRF